MKNVFLMTFLLILLGFKPAYALKLFGVELITATKTSLSQAARNAGARLKKQAGEFEFYDEYFSADILENSDKLFLGFAKSSERFVFAEYEFKGLNNEKMLLKLISKYGEPKKIKQVFISDTIYRWHINGIELSYYKDWQQYKTRVIYSVPDLLAELKIAKKAVDDAIVRGKLNKQVNVY